MRTTTAESVNLYNWTTCETCGITNTTDEGDMCPEPYCNGIMLADSRPAEDASVSAPRNTW